jgi:hypothetical protein
VDQNIPYQQNLDERTISLLILCGVTNRMVDLQRLIPAELAALAGMQPGQIVRVS